MKTLFAARIRDQTPTTWLSIVTCFMLVGASWWTTTTRAEPDERDKSSHLVERGRYLAHDVAMCVQCHSPRDARGKLNERRRLMGGAIPVQEPGPGGTWGLYAPRLAGLPGWSRQELAQLLHTGRGPDGFSPRAPMPPYRMNKEDATAVAEYLDSLQ